METLINNLNFYILPPILSLAMGISLACISLIKGKHKPENILFSIVCIWWSLLSPIFISHHLFRGNVELIMKIERSIHFLYVFLPFLNLLFYNKMIGTGNRHILMFMFILSFLFSLTTLTDYYIYGLYVYPWGYMAKGGIAFHLFGLYGTAIVVYFIVFFFRKIRTEKNQIIRLKLKYILFSFNLIGLLTISNIPAMNGVDFYPLGNFMFLPLAFMGYGVLSYRLMDIRSVLHLTLIWSVMSSLVLIPNIALFVLVNPYLYRISSHALFILVVIWFVANFFYFKKVQPLIDQLFNRRKYDLRRIESSFIDNISTLKTLEDLITQFTDLIRKTLFFKTVDMVICNTNADALFDLKLESCAIDPDIEAWFVKSNHLVDYALVESRVDYADVREGLLRIFRRNNAMYMVPFIQHGQLLALLLLPEKQNLRQITRYEVNFINNIRSAAAIALDNSIMYSNLNKLKDHLEQKVDERTAELKKTRDILLSDLGLAQKMQFALLPQRLPRLDNAEIQYKYVPMMGVGGDFFDILITSRDKVDSDDAGVLCLFICDVSGHGVPAALTASMVKMSLSSWQEYAFKPAQHMGVISKLLEGKMGGNFVTGIISFLELKSGRFIFANAGHPPLIIIRADGTTEMIDPDGGMISDFRPPDCRDNELFLHNNDMVILYTDGVIEERNEDEFFGEDRFIDILKLNYKAPLDVLCDAVFDSLIKFKGDNSMSDDFTFVVVRYKSSDL